MIPTRSLWTDIAELLAADTATLAPAVNANHVHLAAAPFTPSLDLELADLTEATFTGSTEKSAGTGTQQVGIDMSDGQLTITILEPAGGWRWECSAAPGAPETIYGYYLTDNADAVLFGAALLEAPVTIDDAGQFVEVGTVTFKFSADSPS